MIYFKTRELGQLIQQSEEYKRLEASKTANDNDKELQDLIGKFNLTRTSLSMAMQEESKDEEKIASLDKELKDLYSCVMENKNMLEFNESRQEVETLMTKINNVLTASVNGEDPMTCDENPHSCGGSCSSCSGCH
ncbi:MAG: YlbF family regulator [Oscillospiraceae bacterium]